MKGVALIKVSLCLIFAFAASCSNEKKKQAVALLSQQPFKPYTDSIHAFPENGKFYLLRASLLSQQNLHDLARDDYRKAWDLLEDETSSLEYASNLLLVQDTMAALDLLKKCRKQFPENSEFNRRLSELYTETGQLAAAVKEVETALQRDSMDFMTWYELGQLSIRLGDTNKAVAALEHSYRIHPAPFTGVALAGLYSALQSPRVLEICDDLLHKDSSATTADALFLKGVYYADKKQYSRALDQFNQCIYADWKFIDAYIEKGILYYEMKSYQKALSVFATATAVSPAYPDSYFWMGRCNEKIGSPDDARDNYRKALQLDPGFSEAKTRLGQLEHTPSRP